jgi:ParB family chromosome partitioning protein
MDRDEKYLSESIFWLEVDRIKPNPYQPRKVFDEAALNSLAESIRQYGVLQPLVVTKRETEIADEGIRVEYELISGERRLRASKIARVHQVPVVIRKAENSDKIKLELAIIENLQREDLNAVDRAKAFKQLIDEFKLSHVEVGKKMGKSREYVSNTLRILTLPEDMQQALMRGDISEGHTRPLLMLAEKKEEQAVLFKEITDKHMTVREAEQIARRIAVERARKADLTPELLSLEKQLTEKLGTRVRIEQKEKGGKVLIDFFSPEDLAQLVAIVAQQQQARVQMPPTPLAPDAA